MVLTRKWLTDRQIVTACQRVWSDSCPIYQSERINGICRCDPQGISNLNYMFICKNGATNTQTKDCTDVCYALVYPQRSHLRWHRPTLRPRFCPPHWPTRKPTRPTGRVPRRVSLSLERSRVGHTQCCLLTDVHVLQWRPSQRMLAIIVQLHRHYDRLQNFPPLRAMCTR